jgi:hypothetical protein
MFLLALASKHAYLMEKNTIKLHLSLLKKAFQLASKQAESIPEEVRVIASKLGVNIVENGQWLKDRLSKAGFNFETLLKKENKELVKQALSLLENKQ